MQRSEFGTWGATLGEQEFWRAVVVLGAQDPDQNGHRPWRLPAAWRPAEDCLRDWNSITPVRLAVDSGFKNRAEFEACGVISLYYAVDWAEPELDWQWPVRFGFLEDAASEDLFASLVFERGNNPTLHRLTLATSVANGGECEFLVVRNRSALSSAQFVSAACLILCEPYDGDIEAAGALAAQVSASGVLFAGDAYNPIRLIWDLAHNNTLDATLSGTTLISTPKLVEVSRLSSFVRKVADELDELGDRPLLNLDSLVAEELGLGSEMVSGSQVASALRRRLERPGDLFNEERRGASWTLQLRKLAKDQMVAEPLADAAAADGDEAVSFSLDDSPFEMASGAEPPDAVVLVAPVRYLQARIERPEITVFIDAPRSGAVVADAAFPAMPEDGKPGHWLTIVFSCPALRESVQVKQLYLPRKGPSNEVVFDAGLSVELEARITVLYQNRVLQTALLVRDELKVEMDVRPGMTGLDQQAEFDAAIVLNHTSDGVARATAGAGEDFATFSIEGLDITIQQIEARINSSKWAAADMQSLDLEGAESFMRYLARKGSALFQEFARYSNDVARLKSAGCVQVVAREHAARLPVEFFYDRTPPTGEAKLCGGWRKALENGNCECLDSEDTICPLGFWCLSKVIEWHRFDLTNEDKTGNRAFALKGSRPGEGPQKLPDFDGVVVAISEKVDKAVAGTSAALEATLQQQLGTVPRSVKAWKDLAASVAQKAPGMLIFVPHTLLDEDDLPAMEIGGDRPLASVNLKRDYVAGPEGSPHPIVLLFGCNTDNSGLPHEGFVARFSDHRASVVVSSISKVLGRHAAPLAGELVTRLVALRQAGGGSVGEAMRELRRRSLLDGPPVAMVLKVYGDADWRI